MACYTEGARKKSGGDFRRVTVPLNNPATHLDVHHPRSVLFLTSYVKRRSETAQGLPHPHRETGMQVVGYAEAALFRQ